MNEYYGNNDYRDYLALRHHGILGMKWGQINGPPYPLGSGDHSASEKKAGWRKSLSNYEAAKAKKRRNKYVEKETVRTTKQYDRDIKRINKKLQKRQQKLSEAKDGDASVNRISRLENKVEDSRSALYIKKEMKRLELKKVRNMSVNDVSKEKKKLAQATVKSVLITVGGTAALATAHVPLVVYSVPNYRNVKTNNRVSVEERMRIDERAMKRRKG